MLKEYIVRFLPDFDSIEVVKMQGDTGKWVAAVTENHMYVDFDGIYKEFKTLNSWKKGVEKLVRHKIDWNSKTKMKYFKQSKNNEEIIVA